MTTKETHEPDIPINWPLGHVAVDTEPNGADSSVRLRLNEVGVTITDLDDDECMMIRLGDYSHYLHSTTTRALSNMIRAHGDRAAAITIHGVSHTLNRMAVRALSQQLQTRLDEWNRGPIGLGLPGV